jgi:hypothetical protein
MGKVVKRYYYNNGYGCSCCRLDWEDFEWIDEEEIPSVEEFFCHDTLDFLDKNVANGGIVGVTYEKDGRILYGIISVIYRAVWYFNAVWGDCDFYDEHEIKIDRMSSDGTKFGTEEILKKYYKHLEEDGD